MTQSDPRENKEGKIQCLVCGEYFWYLHPSHFAHSHSEGEPSGYEEYKTWVADEYDLDEDDDLLEDDTVINPNKWAAKRHNSDLPIGFKPK